METAEAIIRAALMPRRWARLEAVLAQRLGAVRVVVENLYHPHNMSAVLRTAEALGIQHVHVVDEPGHFEVSRRISMGAHKWLTVHRHREFGACADELTGAGFRLYAALLDPGAVALEEVPVAEPVALVLGNEKDGVSPAARARCHGAYTIPMAGFVQSLNVSVAAAVSLYDVTRRARAERPDGGLLAPAERAEVLARWLPKSARFGARVARAAGGEDPPG